MILLASAAAAQVAPTAGTAVVLRVGPLSVTRDDFYREFRKAAVADTSTLTPDHRGAEKFLHRFADELILRAWAMRDTTVLSPVRRISLEESIIQVYKDALRDELFPRYVKVDDDLLRRVYQRMGTDLRLAAIRVPTYAELDSAKAALASGLPFGDVARRWSRASSPVGPGGEIGWVQAKSFPPDAQEILWALETGSVSPAIHDANFHSIYRVLEQRSNPSLRSFDEERAELYRAMITPLLGKAGGEMHADLMTAYHFRVDPDNAEWLRAFLQKATAGVRRGYDAARDKAYSEPEKPLWTASPFTEAEGKRPIAYVDGDTLPAIEFIDQLMFMPSIVWPTFENVSDVSDVADEALYDRAQAMEAKKLGLGKRPEYERRILEKRGVFYWRGYRATKLLPSLEPTEQEIRALYERGRSKYDLPERRRFVLINVPTLDLAQEAVARFRKGLVPSSIVREIGRPDLNFMVTPDTTAGWSVFGQLPGIDMTLFGLKKGEVSGPIADQGGYSVFRVEDISPAHVQTLDDVRAGLRRGLILQREKAAVAELLRKVRPEFKIWTDPAAIAAMPIDPAQFQKRAKGPMD